MFQFTGVTSGIEWGDMIDTIMEAARKPVETWEAEQDTLELKVGLYEEFSAVLKSVRSTFTSLKLASTFKTKAAEVTSLSSGLAGNAVLTATATTEAYIDQWDIEVLQKATTEQRIGDRFSSSSTALGLSGTFFVRSGSQRVAIEVASSDSLRDINLKLSQAVDDHGNSLNITSKLVDNRLVITSAFSGLGSSTGSSATVTRGSWTDGTGGADYLPLPGEGGTYPTITKIASGTTTYTEGTDYTYDQSTGTITWLSGGARPGADSEYTVTFDGEYTWNTNTFALEAGTGDDILSSLGLNVNDDEHHIAAQDALLIVDGVRVTRSSNEIDDLIGGVTLKLQGPGKVLLDITTDMEQAVTAIQNFVDAYNDAMDWINIRLSEESDEDAETDFDKKFGLLHGDSLLWQIKDQLRRLLSDPQNILGPLKQLSQIGITTESSDYGKSGKLEFDSSVFMQAATPGSLSFLDQWMSDAFSDSKTPLNELKTGFTGGTFSITVGGKTATISVKATDTLTDVSAKIAAARDSAGNALRLRSSIVDNTLSLSSTNTGENLSFTDPDGVLLALGIDIANPEDATHHVQDTSAYVGNLVTTLMSKLDTYFGNLVDSSQVQVGSTVAIKGRIASRINSLTTQISTIDERIAAFEKQLSIKERGLNDRFSQMETILSQLNQQAEWLASTLSALSGTSS
jgi:flagellar capping protein FliD